MNNGSIRYYSIAILLFTVLLSSCLHEQTAPIASSFSIEIAEDKTAPVIIKLQNDSYGADEYEWTFEGGEPSSSREKQPGAVTFAEAGEHKDTSSCEACRWGEGERTAHTSRFYAFLLCRAPSLQISDEPSLIGITG